MRALRTVTALKMSTWKTYDVAVLGWWYGKNYGSILTYYGLTRAIGSLGRSVLMVHEALGYSGYRVAWPDDILSMEFARRVGYAHTEQMHCSELPRLNDVARTFVAKHAANLQQFKAISVREEYAISTARDVFGVTAKLVVDPVFLLPDEHYRDLASTGAVTPEGDYMTVFFLDPTPEKAAVAQAIADKLGFEKILVIPNPEEGRELTASLFADEPRAEIMAEDAPENFLRGYRDASYVVTDSFHGSVFAAIFEKPFSSLYNVKRGADRFKNLMTSLGLGDSRRVFETDSAEKIAENANVTRGVDFAKAREYIETGRASSMAWLKAALDPVKKGSARGGRRQTRG